MFALNQGEVCTCPSRSPDPGRHLRRVPGAGGDPHQGGAPGRSAGHRDHDRRAGLQRPAGEDPVLHRDRQGRGRQGHHRRRARRTGRRPERRLLRAADDLHRQQQDADLPGGDLRPGGGGDVVQGLRRRHLASPTTPSTGWAPGCGAATATPPTGPAATSRPAGCGPTATTPTPRTRRSAATSSPASAARTTR